MSGEVSYQGEFSKFAILSVATDLVILSIAMETDMQNAAMDYIMTKRNKMFIFALSK